MKLLFVIAMMLLCGCSTSSKPSNQDAFVSLASQYLHEYKKNCYEENGKTWGTSLCVPMIILNRENLEAVTSELDPDGKFQKIGDVFQGVYSGDPVYANTSMEWKGKRWSMVLWPLPEDPLARTQLMFHEAFHSIQNDIGFPMNGAMNSHLDSEKARLLIRLEWSALVQAIQSEDPDRIKKNILIALQLRFERYKKYPGAKKNEEDLEINEGLAEYTGLKLRGSSTSETNKYLEAKLLEIPKIFSLTRSSAYYSGPLYGLLFDKVDSNWKNSMKRTKSFPLIAKSIFKVHPPKNEKILSTSELESFGYSSIASYEKQRATEINAKINKYLKQIHQPGHVEIPLERPQGIFNPYGILAINSNELIYTTYDVTDIWGKLIAKDGVHLKIGKHSMLSIDPPINFTETEARGSQWELKLNPGWKIIKKQNVLMVKKF